MKNNVVKSISYLEFVNNLTSLVNKLLYSPEDGYLSWSSKNAVLNYNSIIKKFDSEAIKLVSDSNFSDIENVVNSKKHNLIAQMQKHYEAQILIWAQDVFDDLIENSFFQLSLNKDKSEELYKQLVSSIDWICEIKSYNNEERCAMIDELTLKFNAILKTNDNDYIPKQHIKKSDEKIFCNLWDCAINTLDEFVSLDLNEYSNKLIIEDIKFFENLKIKLNSYKKTSQIDELILISSAIDLLKISSEEQKYLFIKQINNDFVDFFEQNKKLAEIDKINIIKRRISLFSNDYRKAKEYYKNIIIS